VISPDKRHSKRSFLKLRVFSGISRGKRCGDSQLLRYLGGKLEKDSLNPRNGDRIVTIDCELGLYEATSPCVYTESF